MELANQNQAQNPLDDHSLSNGPSATNLKLLTNEYSIQLDADTIKYLTTKRKPSLVVANDDENEMRKKKRSIFFDRCFVFF